MKKPRTIWVNVYPNSDGSEYVGSVFKYRPAAMRARLLAERSGSKTIEFIEVILRKKRKRKRKSKTEIIYNTKATRIRQWKALNEPRLEL